MAEALVECGIGIVRALVVEDGVVHEAHAERADAGALAGAIHVARLTRILEPGRRGIMDLGGSEGLIEPLPYCPEGGLMRVAVTRSAIPEAGRPRLAKLHNIEGEAVAEGEVTSGPDLVARLRAAGHRVTILPASGPDRLEALGWSEIVDMAQSGFVGFAGGTLTISPTPAMTVIDIDGPGDPAVLADVAAAAVAAAIRRFDLTGSIGVDFPTLAGKAARTQLGDRLDAHLPPPFERTAINGFGFVQIVRPRARPSFIELARAPGFAALELLRRAGRGGTGGGVLVAPPAQATWLAARPELLAALGRMRGGSIGLRSDAALGMAGGHVEPA